MCAPQDQHVISVIDRSPSNMDGEGCGAWWIQQPGNSYRVFGNGDVILFEARGIDNYDVHYLFEKAGGRAALDQVREAFGHMFTVRNAFALYGKTPVSNRAARIFNRLIGGKSLGTVETPFGPCEEFFMTREMWKAL